MPTPWFASISQRSIAHGPKGASHRASRTTCRVLLVLILLPKRCRWKLSEMNGGQLGADSSARSAQWWMLYGVSGREEDCGILILTVHRLYLLHCSRGAKVLWIGTITTHLGLKLGIAGRVTNLAVDKLHGEICSGEAKCQLGPQS